MRYTKSLLLLVFTILSYSTIFSQVQLGLRLETYAGVSSLSLNPANGPSSSFSWDLNLVGAGLFGETNYGFIYNTNVSEILNTLPDVDIATNYSDENQYPGNMLIVDFNNNSRKKYFNGSAIVLGPSVLINLGSGHSFGVFTNLRTEVSAQGVPPTLNYDFFDSTPFGQEFLIKPFSAAGMTWSELGINYARRIPTLSGNLDIGMSFKFLNGYEGFFFNNEKTFGLTQLPGDTLAFSGPSIEYGLTTSNATGTYGGVNRNGGGIAVDLGAVYTIDGFDDGYKWKFGVALIDIGKINFSRNAQSHTINTIEPFSLRTRDYSSVTDLDGFVELLSEQTLGDSDLSLTERSFGIWLPGALSLQADYNVASHVFVNATLLQRLPYKKNAVKRGNLLALTPRFEHRWFSASMPISLYNYNRFRVGAALRLGLLTVGTDNLTSFVGQSNFTGSDIYFALKINPFELGTNRGGIRKKGKGVKCYEF